MLLVFVLSCSSDPSRGFRKSVASYAAGEISASRLKNELLAFAVAADMGRDAEMAGDVPVLRWSDRVEILYPGRRDIRCDNAGSMRFFTLSGENAAASDGTRILFFPDGDEKGREVVRIPAGKDSYTIRALAISGDRIYYYSDGRIWFSDGSGKDRGALGKERYSAPYGQFYTVAMSVRGDDLAILAGLAGSYNFSVVDIPTGRARLKNWSLASRRYLLADNEVMCVKGGSGNWALVRTALPAEKPSTIRTFGSLSDIAIFPMGYIYRKNGFLFINSSGTDLNIPLNMEIAGSDGINLFVRMDGSLLRMDFERLRVGMDLIRENCPGFN